MNKKLVLIGVERKKYFEYDGIEKIDVNCDHMNNQMNV